MAKKGVAKKTIGRPTKFNQKLVDEICIQISEGKSLRSICSDESMPNMSTVIAWRNANEDFSKQYAQAREDQADTLADELIDIADNATDPAKARLQVDVRKWAASKLKSKSYGDKVVNEHTGADGGPIVLWGGKDAD